MKWEYKTKRANISCITQWCNDEGQFGWELVSVVAESYNPPVSEMIYVLVFKRKL